MRILKREESTNCSNIGSYKNTPNVAGIEPTLHYKPIPGSHTEWHKHKLRESLTASDALKDWGITVDEFIQLIISRILQNDKWESIQNYLEGDNLDSDLMSYNWSEFSTYIRNNIAIDAITYLINNPNQNPAELSYIFNNKDLTHKIDEFNDKIKIEENVDDKPLITEGILDDILHTITDNPNIPEIDGTAEMNKLLKPHTIKDVYNGVVYTLQNKCNNNIVKNEIMPGFFSDKGKKMFADKHISPQLVTVYKAKFEEIVADYVSKDGVDIIKRVQSEFIKNDPEYNINEINGDVYMGTILKNVTTGQYDIVDKLKNTYRQFLKDSEKPEWQTSEDSTNYIRNNNSSKIDNVVKDICKKYSNFEPNTVSNAIADILQSDVFKSILDSSLKSANTR